MFLSLVFFVTSIFIQLHFLLLLLSYVFFLPLECLASGFLTRSVSEVFPLYAFLSFLFQSFS